MVVQTGISLLVDPYEVTGAPHWSRINAYRTQRDSDGRRVHVGFNLLRSHRTVLTGNSRMWDGIGRQTAPWGGDTFNAAMPSGNAFEIGRALTLAGRSGVDCVVLGLELTDYDAVSKVKGSFWISPLLDGSAGLSTVRMSLSQQTFSRAVQTASDNIRGRKSDSPWPQIYRPGEQRERYFKTGEGYWASVSSYAYDPERVRYIETIVDRLTARGVQVAAVFTPTHAFATEALFRAGAGPALFAWRREMTSRLSALAGRRPSRPCFPGGSVVIWDFSGYQPFSLTPFPGPRETQPDLWFYETTHFTPRIGAALLARIGGRPAGDSPGAPFGLQVTPARLADADAALLARRRAWLGTAQGREAGAFYERVLARRRIRPAGQRFYLAAGDWAALDRDLPAH